VSLASSYEGTLAYFGAPDVVVEAEADEALAGRSWRAAAERELPASATVSAGDTLDLDHGLHGAAGLPVRRHGETRAAWWCSPSRILICKLTSPLGRWWGKPMLEAKHRMLYVASSDLSPSAEAPELPRASTPGGGVRPARRRSLHGG